MTTGLSRDEYQRLDATALADLIRRGEITRADALNCALELAHVLNPELNAFVEIFEEALVCDKDGPFAGVPFAIKDIVCHAKGVLNENGSRLCAGSRARHDTALMQRFRAAGLATIGRTATPEFGYCATTESRANGPTRNPWNRNRSPGGSSGGSGAAVAAGIVPFAHANDGGGSIRVPASCTGLVGLKPTRGRVSVGPDIGEALNGIAIEFAVTRSVRDCAALLDAVAGPSLGDPYVIPAPAIPYREAIEAPPAKLNIAFTTRAWSGCAIDPVMVSAVHETVKLCESLGHRVSEAMPPLDNEPFMQATHVYWSANLHHWIKQVAAGLGRTPDLDGLEATTMKCYAEGAKMSAEDLLMAFAVTNHVTREFAAFFSEYDVLVTPTAASPALPLGTIRADDPNISAREWTEMQFRFVPFTAQFNMTGQPAISLPLHRSDTGLPVGVQFAARHYAEDMLLTLAAQLEAAAPWPCIAPPRAAAA